MKLHSVLALVGMVIVVTLATTWLGRTVAESPPPLADATPTGDQPLPPRDTLPSCAICAEGFEPCYLYPCDGSESWLASVGLHFFSEAGVNLIRPIYRHNPAVIVSRPVAGPAGPAGFGSSDFRYDLAGAPRLMLGIVNHDNWGLSADWSYFDQSADTIAVRNGDPTFQTSAASIPMTGVPGVVSPTAAAQVFGTANAVMTFDTHLKLSVFDADVFHDKVWHGWICRTTLGARYAYLSQNYDALSVDSGPGLAADNAILSAGHNFCGVGPSTAMIVRRPLGNTGFLLYFSDRVSVLMGSSSTQALQVNQTAGPGFNTITGASFRTSQTICVPNEDVEAGFEYARDVGDARLFLRTSFIDQTWFDVGNAAHTHGNLSFLGFGLVAGVIY
jgi:hypothetical protein